jgi:hypothetical protein
MTVRPAAGPLTENGVPCMAPTSRPPTIPVTRPSAGGTPDARAIPRQSGRATRNTTTEASASAARVRRCVERFMTGSPLQGAPMQPAQGAPIRLTWKSSA